MILEGNARGFGAELARHLLNVVENDHVSVHALTDFATGDLTEALAEAEAISCATQCQKYLFSLSLNPPKDVDVPVEVFEAAIARIEQRLGLNGQPRAIVFHEKNGRRHAHCVWSRIDGTQLKAINLPHYKRKLTTLSREIFLEHGWEMPPGLAASRDRDPNAYSRDEAQQAKRGKRDAKALKALFRACWERSDMRDAFAAALREQGFALARGDRRGFVAVDAEGNIFSLSRWCGVRPKELRKKLGSEDDLPSVKDVLAAQELPPPQRDEPNLEFVTKRAALVAAQRKERAELLQNLETRRLAALKDRQARLPKGLKAAWAKLTGQYQTMLTSFEAEVREAAAQDQAERQALVTAQLKARRALDLEARPQPDRAQTAFDYLPPEEGPDLTADQLRRRPCLIIDHVSNTKARFTRADVLREVLRKIADPISAQEVSNAALDSDEILPLDRDRFTTKDYHAASERLKALAPLMAEAKGYGVVQRHVHKALQAQNSKMQRAFGGQLSLEQQDAIKHVLNGSQLSCVVGLAGAGKSTMLEAARMAWEAQGRKVHGAALAGKAADGLEASSGIASRTLASLELAWKNGYSPIKAGDILVIDEAGMIGTRQMRRVMDKIDEIGAKLVLVGDPDQLQPIEAGTPFRHLAKTLMTAKLSEIYRQQAPWQRKASRHLAAGEVYTAVKAYEKNGDVSTTPYRQDALEALVESYAMDALANPGSTSRLAFAHRRKDVHALNQGIRAALREDSSQDVVLGTDTGRRAFGQGDRIVFGRNDKLLGVSNGMLGTVDVVSDNTLTVTLDHGRRVSFDPRRYRSFDHGYAVTIHKSQGATVDEAYVLASRTMDRHLAYVAMTRHRSRLQLFQSTEDRPRWVSSRTHQPSRTRNRSGPSPG